MFEIRVNGTVKRTPTKPSMVRHWVEELNTLDVSLEVWFSEQVKSTVVRPWKNNKKMMTESKRLIAKSPIGTDTIIEVDKCKV